MSVPYGAPQQQQPQAGSPAQPAGGLSIESILAIVGAGLGLVVYLLAFGEEYIAPTFGVGGDARSATSLLVIAGILAGLALLPKGPQLQLLSSLIAVVGVLSLLQHVVHWPGDVSAMAIVALIVGILEAGAIVATWLFKEGIIKAAPKQAYPQQQGNWNPQSGGIPQAGQYGQQAPQAQYGQQQAQYGQAEQQSYGQQAAPATGGQPAQPAPQYGQQGTEIFGGVAQQPGQYGQGTPPPGGYGQG
ncbi:DUF5336 domain-containing protein [Actinoalloteichus hymeniacidonis]|uniref:Uncharacterized protein n=1 Tax=Actinoalloteichus hymeniacidonis TaxID=340345 RepID=A0AAC9HUN7_9PSEU|nr:DUF5336 domain-containing protein [Actinoalloteichus hymeniacidonis]AOS65695.1 hypothetical protein TL08_24585 [Actinoalloteichus hymeniacidonis]MBB5906215.1 hypothetical protein [Actinoalloteichus hymeniacidonis]